MRLACLSHAASVQAEPGSNSSIEFRDELHSAPHARRYTETDSFRSDVYPRNEFVQTDRVKTLLGQLLLPPCRLGQRGQSNRLPLSKLRTQRLEQGSNISSGCPGATRGYSQTKLIKEDHFLACTTRMFEGLGAPDNLDSTSPCGSMEA